MRGRVLLVDRNEEVRGQFARALVASGFEVQALDRTTLVPGRLAGGEVDLLVIDADDPTLTGREALSAAERLHGARVAAIFTSEDPSCAALVRATRAGALDVVAKRADADLGRRLATIFDEAQGPLSEILSGRMDDPLQRASELLVAALRRRRGLVRLVVNPLTPFEGSLEVDARGLVRASFLGLSGAEALHEMLSVEEAAWRDVGPPQRSPSGFVRGEDPDRVLVVDDDEAIRTLLSMRLTAAGFDVSSASDGREALELARARDLDVVVTDLYMPRLDGWGLLRELGADARTRELPVIVVSAEDQLRDSLRAASAGARDYLVKPIELPALVDRIAQVLAPRWAADAALVSGKPAELEVGVVGTRWLLKVAGERRLTGRFAISDEFGAYEVALSGGRPISARARVGGRDLRGSHAVRAMLRSRRAVGTFSPVVVQDAHEFEVEMDALLDAACTALNAAQEAALARLLSRDPSFELDHGLYASYLRVAGASNLPIARAFCDARRPLREVAEALNVPLRQVEAVVRDLVQRGVVRPLEGSSPALPLHPTSGR